MENRIIFCNEYIEISEHSNEVFIETFKKGFPMENFYDIMSSHPEIGLTSFTTLRDAIKFAPKPPTKIGELKKPISIEISNSKMAVYIVLNLSAEELNMENRDGLIKKIMDELSKNNIIHGIKHDVLKGQLISGKQYVIAEGTPPVNGRDAMVRMYELADPKPVVGERGKVDFYDIKLINRVIAGDWLGEKTDPTDGMPGWTVTGETIKPVKGRNIPLNYDRNSVQEIYLNGKSVLYSKVNGAVTYSNGKITVSNHMQVDGDINPGTGNIKFDGYVTINGTVADGFTVEATKDIEINGELGIGNIKTIVSTNGSIFLKGGISSKRRSEIRAAKNIFTKYVDNAIITCGGTLHIGYYCINSIVSAREVVVDSANGQIIGGEINADVRVSAPILGSEIERKTIVEVRGFNRSAMVEELEDITRKINKLKVKQQKLKQLIVSFEGNEQFDETQRKKYTSLIEESISVKDELKSFEEERKNIATYLKTKGEGEISISKRIFPNCSLIIKRNIIEVTSPQLATTYYIESDNIKQI